MKRLVKATRFLTAFECASHPRTLAPSHPRTLAPSHPRTLAPSEPGILAWGLLMRSLIGALGRCLADGAHTARGRSRVENATNFAPSLLLRLKGFISPPPVIKNLIFARKVPMNGGMLPLDGSSAYSARFDYFQAKWQTDKREVQPYEV